MSKRCIIGDKTIYLTKETEGETGRKIRNLETQQPLFTLYSVGAC